MQPVVVIASLATTYDGERYYSDILLAFPSCPSMIFAGSYRRRGAILIQDNASCHKGADVCRWFKSNRHWLEVHQLPPTPRSLTPPSAAVQQPHYPSRRAPIREGLIWIPCLSYLTRPIFLNLFMNKLTLERVVPTIFARVS